MLMMFALLVTSAGETLAGSNRRTGSAVALETKSGPASETPAVVVDGSGPSVATKQTAPEGVAEPVIRAGEETLRPTRSSDVTVAEGEQASGGQQPGESADAEPPPLPSTPADEAARLAEAEAGVQRWLTENGVATPRELLLRAKAHIAGEDGYPQRPQRALPLLSALTAAMGTKLVSMDVAADAAVALADMYLLGSGVSRDVDLAEKLFQQAAGQGWPEAQFALGVLYTSGFGRDLNVPLGLTYLYFAAEGGSLGAQLALGYRHLLGVQMPKACNKALLYYNPVAEKVVASAQRLRAGQLIEKVRLTPDNPQGGKRSAADDDVIQYYEHSARKGSVDAQLTLGHLSYHGARGVPADVTRAFQFYAKAAAAGEPAAYSHLGHMYGQGIGVEQDNATAIEYFRKGAAKGHAPSQNGLGYMYMHGYGVKQSHTKALGFFKQAAEKGNAEAHFNLGAMYIAGMGVKKGYDKALHHFTLSAHQGHTLALYNLGQMHLNGLGAPRSCSVAVQFLKAVAERGPWGTQLSDAHEAIEKGDKELPLQLYSTLAEGGYEVAQSNLAFLLDQHFMSSPNTSLLGIERDHLAEQALVMYSRAAQQGNVQAELKLGDYYYYGYGVAVELEQAVHHYRAAAESRNAQAMFDLAYMYAHGLGLTRDFHLAKRHFDMAAEAAPEAFIPVQLALLELHLLQLWEAYTGRTESPLLQLWKMISRWGISGWQPAQLLQGEGALEWDTLLILLLSIVLAYVVAFRMRQQARPPAAATVQIR